MYVQEFDSFEDAQRAMQEAEDAANSRLLTQQQGIGYGDYWDRPYPEYGVFVFGRVWTEQEAAKGESRETVREAKERFTRGYRFGIAYSPLEPRGELGDTHIANMWPITKEDFEIAEANEWHVTEDFVKRVFSEAQAAKREQYPSPMDDSAQFEVVDEDE